MLTLVKPEGITPIDFWKQYRDQHMPKAKGGICGKLDPMASGKMIVLLNDECKKQPHFLTMKKTYTFNVITGISTDTDDILGLLTTTDVTDTVDWNKYVKQITEALEDYKNIQHQVFHEYSSIRVQGSETDGGNLIRKPLWWWSNRGLIDRITPPQKPITIYKMEVGQEIIIPFHEYVTESIDRLSKLRVDPLLFRVPQICARWQELQNRSMGIPYNIICIPVTVSVSSGTYVRQIVRDVSTKLGVPLLCDKICRTDIYF